MIEYLHYEDIKASIRKTHGSLNAFEAANGLPKGSVCDWGRGKMSQRVQDAIALHLSSITRGRAASDSSEHSRRRGRVHRQNRTVA